MLQQTQASRVVPRYVEVMRRFPTPAACAAAPVGDLVRCWAGLGYNRRAVTLHRAATAVVADHGGHLPATVEALTALPGVGPYTARAVLAFAFEADVGAVDTNARRVLCRAVAGRPLRPSEVQTVADAAVPPGRGWAWNQAVMDLGATVCRQRRPACPACPLAGVCAWASSGRSGTDPGATESGRQAPFAGSDRQGRGRLVAALRRGPVPLAELAEAAGWPDQPERAPRVAERLVADGLAAFDGRRLR
jgi:A/G-specific adenine glycosylase